MVELNLDLIRSKILANLVGKIKKRMRSHTINSYLIDAIAKVYLNQLYLV